MLLVRFRLAAPLSNLGVIEAPVVQPNPWSLASPCAGGSLAANLEKKEGRWPLRGASFRERTAARRSTSSSCRSFPACDASYSASPIGAGHGVPRAHDARVPLRADGRDLRPRGMGGGRPEPREHRVHP